MTNAVPEAAGLDVRKVYRAADGTDRYAAAARFADKRVDARRHGIDDAILAVGTMVRPSLKAAIASGRSRYRSRKPSRATT